MKKWFRLYAEIIDDGVMRLLSFDDQRHFVWLLALKCDGTLDKKYPRPEILDNVVGVRLGLQGDALHNMRARLLEMGLIGADWQPLGWHRRQKSSDADITAIERQRKRRARATRGTDSHEDGAGEAAVTEMSRRCHGDVTRDISVTSQVTTQPPKPIEQQPISLSTLKAFKSFKAFKDLKLLNIPEPNLSHNSTVQKMKEKKARKIKTPPQDLEVFSLEEKNAEEKKARKIKTTPPQKAPPLTAAVWGRYSAAYTQRYGVAPLRNATVNSQLAQFVKQVGLSNSSELAEFYLQHNENLFVRAKHPVSLMLRDAQKLYTEWVTKTTSQSGKRITTWTPSRNWPGYELEPGQRDPVTEEAALALQATGAMRVDSQHSAWRSRIGQGGPLADKLVQPTEEGGIKP